MAQEGKKGSFFNPLENSIDVAINSAKNAYAIGNYDKAKEISKRLSPAVNSSDKKQELINLGIASDKQLKLRYEAHTALRVGEYEKAIGVYEKILAANPRDIVAKGAINNVKRIINKSNDDSYGTALGEAKRLYDLALNNNRLSDQQKISYLEKARKIWVAIERTSNSTRVGLVQNINSANDLLSAVRRLAGAGSKERERIVAEITSKYPAAGDFITTVIDPPPTTESLFNLTYAQGIYFLRDCNYNESLECFKEAHKIRPGAAKTKKYYYDLMALIKLNKQIEELKRSTNSTPNEVLQLFNRIQQINVGFEVVQSNSSCTDSSGVMCSYIWEELPKTATKYNCDRIVSLSDKLFNCYLTNDQKAEVDQLRTACEQITNECIIAPKLIQGRIQEAQKLQNQEFHEASNSLLESIEADRNRLISICADFESEKFKELISAIRKENDRLIRLKNCTTIQEKAIREAISKAEEGLCNESKIAFFAADTSCLSQQFIREAKVELERVVTLCRKTQMQVYEDSAARSKQILFYKDEGIFLLKALTFTDTEADKSRIQTRLAINKCYRETGKNCEDVKPPPPCNDTTTIKQTNIQFLVGLNLSSLNLESLSPVIRFRNLIKTGSYKPTPHIGLRLNRQSFKKNIDFNTSLVYTPPTELSFLNDNGSNFSKLKYNNLDFDFNLKFHRLRDCNNKGRAYIFAGGNAGYKKLSSVVSATSTTSEYVSENYSQILLAGFQGGIGYEFPKDRLNFEIEFKRQAMFSNGVDNFDESNSIFNSPFSLGYVGVKIGYTVKNWTSPKK